MQIAPTSSGGGRLGLDLKFIQKFRIMGKVRKEIEMATTTAAEFQKQFGKYRDLALSEPVTVTHHGRESLVIISADEYRRLKSLEKDMTRETEKMLDERLAVHRETLQKLALR